MDLTVRPIVVNGNNHKRTDTNESNRMVVIEP
jgi:hypothetical protein